jgi:hypothetical protein
VDSLKALDPERPIREASNNIAAQRMTLSAKRVISRCTKTMKLFRRSTLPGIAVQLELTGEKKAAN